MPASISQVGLSPLGARGHAGVGEPVDFNPADPKQKQVLITFAVAVVVLLFVYLEMLVTTAGTWSNDMYSHGYIIPVLAGALFWVRRKGLVPATASEVWAGAGMICVALLVRIFAATYNMEPLDRYSFLLALLGAVVLSGGWRMLSWAWLPVLFLFFMYPLPTVVELRLLVSLQEWAAKISAVVLQVLGTGVLRVGNQIKYQGEDLMEVAEVCSGLRMATILSAMAVAMVFFIERPWWDRLIVLLSALPIAFIVNVARIVVTGLIFIAVKNTGEAISPEMAEWIDQIAHDWMGLAMPIAAVGLIYLELAILSKLSVPEETVELKPAGMSARPMAPIQ
ncbi:Transmembrane exosortase (Exosortase_EpsH) [Pirellulimonas nuda]|uniref:Transmembrane exosortase (Exosortase_EpsH) n=1 Tax=Pirellulimonas nuda TaxID=2528009 RepID=A0A518DJL3_9BACT|nr:exosortase [Pirellulimonas nuda]QDU91669.1 Transmembrane exosortase (Exosortase_EpsH) [Pirellulimonas nuda]